ncbi:MAG TPA: hypothetical protein VMB46_08245 [Methanomassiliicoccales archaeon]|nr:hypothetical protein [Methanomassiliicoccales archaeon]
MARKGTKSNDRSNVSAEASVRRALQALQKAYAERDPSKIDVLVKEVFSADDDVTVLSTAGTLPGKDDWPITSEGAKQLLLRDWRSWGDVLWDVKGARITVAGDVAWLDANAFVEKYLDHDEAMSNHLRYVRSILESGMNDRDKVAEIGRGASNVLVELSKGERFVWPLRFTAVLQFADGKWRFRQMHFSFPTTRFPDERLTDVEGLPSRPRGGRKR